MLLYAKTTSDRASKGQGGKWLKIEITDENKKLLGVIDIFPADENNPKGLISYKWLAGDKYEVKDKGERQKGDTCENCGKDIPEFWEMTCPHCGK